MAIDFPNSPSLNDTFTVGAVTWKWDGSTWKSTSLEEAQYLLGVTSNIQTQIDGKAATAHTHAISDVTNLQTSLDGKAASSHTHAQSDITNLTTDLAAKASLIGTETLTNKTLTNYNVVGQTREDILTSGTGFAGYTYNVMDDGVQYITANSTANGTVNFRGNADTTMNIFMAVNQSVTCALLVTNGATPYYPTAFQIDGNAITAKWQGGTAPTAGNANSIDVYTFTIIKTASATYQLLASQTKFA